LPKFSKNIYNRRGVATICHNYPKLYSTPHRLSSWLFGTIAPNCTWHSRPTTV